MSTSQYIQTLIDHDVATIWLNRSEKGNALNIDMIRELKSAVKKLEIVPEIEYVVIKSKGKHFCLGADLSWMAAASVLSEAENLKESIELAELFEYIYFSSKLYFSIVNGACYGGGIGLAAACDFVFAADNSSFSFGEVKLGLVPATIAPFVINRMGAQKAKFFMLGAQVISANKSAELGLSDLLFEKDGAEKALTEFIQQLNHGGPEARKTIKSLVNSLSLENYNSEIKNLTAEIIAKSRVSAEGKEGVTAFIEKRKPAWRK